MSTILGILLHYIPVSSNGSKRHQYYNYDCTRTRAGERERRKERMIGLKIASNILEMLCVPWRELQNQAKKRWIFMGGNKSKVTSEQFVSRNASTRREQSNIHRMCGATF